MGPVQSDIKFKPGCAFLPFEYRPLRLDFGFVVLVGSMVAPKSLVDSIFQLLLAVIYCVVKIAQYVKHIKF